MRYGSMTLASLLVGALASAATADGEKKSDKIAGVKAGNEVSCTAYDSKGKPIGTAKKKAAADGTVTFPKVPGAKSYEYYDESAGHSVHGLKSSTLPVDELIDVGDLFPIFDQSEGAYTAIDVATFAPLFPVQVGQSFDFSDGECPLFPGLVLFRVDGSPAWGGGTITGTNSVIPAPSGVLLGLSTSLLALRRRRP